MIGKSFDRADTESGLGGPARAFGGRGGGRAFGSCWLVSWAGDGGGGLEFAGGLELMKTLSSCGCFSHGGCVNFSSTNMLECLFIVNVCAERF